MLEDLRRALRMDSPAPRLSENNLRKLSRGLRSSKKSRLSVQSALDTQCGQDGSLGGRSVSLSTLLPSGGAPGPVPRVDKLQSLEAKMASIEKSLGWRRRREALLETLPRAARDLVRELDTLHQTVREKENCIQGLRTQITNLGGTVSGGSDGSCTVVSEAEKKTIQERLMKVEAEIEAKKVAVKNLKLGLDKIDLTDNIDVRIQAAELEYELEREELNILNLKEEASILTIRLQESCLGSPMVGEPLTENPKTRISLQELLAVPGNAFIVAGVSLITTAVSHTPGNPPFHITFRPPFGCVIDWATDDTRLKKGDRILEINGEIVFGKNINDVTKFMSSSSHLTLVVARPNDAITGPRKVEKQLEDKVKENKELLVKIDRILREKEFYKNDNTRLSHRISYLEEQVNDLKLTLQKAKDTAIITGTPNEVLTPSQPGATIIQVFQKGHQTLAVAGTETETSEDRVQEYPTLPRLKSPTCSSYDSESNNTRIDEKIEYETHSECTETDKHDESPSQNGKAQGVASPCFLNPERASSSSSFTPSQKQPSSPGWLKEEADKTDTDSTVNVKCNNNRKNSCDYDAIERLRDRLTEKSPSYSYKNSSDFVDDDYRTSFSKEDGEYFPIKRLQDIHHSYSFTYPEHSPHSSPSNLPRRKKSEESCDNSALLSRDDLLSPVKGYGIETKPTINNGKERPSRRIVSPIVEDFKPLRPRPVPPKKPERLSLQRATSMQSVEEGRPCSGVSSTSNRSSSEQSWGGGYYGESLLHSQDHTSNMKRNEEGRFAIHSEDELIHSIKEKLNSTPVPSPRNISSSYQRLRSTSTKNSLHSREDRGFMVSPYESSKIYEHPVTHTSTSSVSTHSEHKFVDRTSSVSTHSEHKFVNRAINSILSSSFKPFVTDYLSSPTVLPNVPNIPSQSHSADKIPSLINSQHHTPHTKSSDAVVNLEASLGLDTHEEVRAQPLYEFLRRSEGYVSSNNPLKFLMSRSSEKGNFEAPPTPSTPPRGINLSIKNSSRTTEDWC